MKSLFSLENDLSAGTYYLNQWPYARQGLLNNIDKIESFYRTYSFTTQSSHVLIRLITAMNLPRSLGYERYVFNAFSRSINVAQALKMTTPTSKGQVWDGDFYGGGSHEILLGHADYFNPLALKENWKEFSPVTVLMHNQTNLNFMLPDGVASSTEKGVAVIAINIPMLMAMYFCYLEEQDAKEQQGLPRGTIAQFIHGNVLVNMTRSHADQVMLNRLYANSNGIPYMPSLRKHSFVTIDYSSAMNSVVEQQNNYLRGVNAPILPSLRVVQSIASPTMREVSNLPKIAPTLQCFWALVASRIKMLAYLRTTQRSEETDGQSEYTRIAWQIRIQQTKNVMKNNLGLEAYYYVAPYLDRARI